MLRHQQVFQNRETRKQANILEGARHLGLLGDFEIRQALEKMRLAVLLAHGDHAHGRLVEAGDAVEDRGLARTVGADQCGDLAALRLEGEVVDGHQAAEAHREMFDLEDRIICHCRRSGSHQP